MRAAADTLEDSKVMAERVSRQNPGKYITLYSCFGLFIEVASRLSVHAPSDSVGGCYWLNGKEKRFTEAQRIADQQATPTLR